MIQTHQTTPIEGHHFTPFATLLYQLPSAIKEVFGNFNTDFFWYHNPRKSGLDLDVYWVKERESYTTARKLTCVTFTRTAYSYGEIVDILIDKKLHNTSTVTIP